jgi:hypothetical protein
LTLLGKLGKIRNGRCHRGVVLQIRASDRTILFKLSRVRKKTHLSIMEVKNAILKKKTNPLMSED